MFTNTYKVSGQIIAALAAVSMLMSAFPVAFFVAEAQTAQITPVSPAGLGLLTSGNTQVKLCHANNGYGSGFSTVQAKANVLYHNSNSGHPSSHDDDIIPPFEYQSSGSGGLREFQGRNWDLVGQAIYNNGCSAFTAPAVSIDPVVLQCEPKYVDVSGSVTFEDPTSQDSLVLKLDGSIVMANTAIDDVGPDGIPQPWSYSIPGVAIGAHTLEIIMYDDDVNNTGLKASDGPIDFTVEACPPTTSDETIVVTENTISLAGGWWFNRDAGNATPIEFNEDEASIGNGSLYVECRAT